MSQVSVSDMVTMILNATLESIQQIIPNSQLTSRPQVLMEPIIQEEMGVLVGITGAVPGRLVIQAHTAVFRGVVAEMFSVELDGEMLESFVGELGNMIGGRLAMLVAQQQLHMDITPPTVLVGHTKLGGFSKAIQIGVGVGSAGDVKVALILQEPQQ